MRVAIITESFPPDINGVAHTVQRVAELLARFGHHPLVIAPQPPRNRRPGEEEDQFPYPVVRVPAAPLPGYPGFRLGLPGARVRAALVRHQPDIVHLASPVFLGAHGAAVARRLGLPAVAVYQTDLPSYARAYHLGRAGQAFAWRWLRGIHNGAARTLAPSTVTATGLPSVPGRRLGGDDQRVMPVAGEEFGDALDGVGDAVDVGRERFGNDRDPHALTVRHQPIGASQPP